MADRIARDLAATVREALKQGILHMDEPRDALAALAVLEKQAADAQAERDSALRQLDQRDNDYIEEHDARVRAEEALRRIKANAEDWHGPESEGTGAAKALAVIARWCDEVLAATGADTP